MTEKPIHVLFTVPPGGTRDELWTTESRKLAESLGYDVAFSPHEVKPADAVWADMLQGVDALITTWGAPRLTAAVLAKADALKIVGHAAGSVAGIVSPDLFARGIRVVTANPVMAYNVAVWSLMMTLVGRRQLLDCAKLGPFSAMRWDNREDLGDLRNAVISIWGYGDIAQRFIHMLQPLEPRRILVHDDYLTPAMAAAAGVEKVGFDELFRQGDVIHLLAALTETNLGRVGQAQLAAIRNGAVLLNTGRAGLIQQDALLAELRKSRFTAAFDVHYQEPPPPDYPFFALPNVILTPHCAGASAYGAALYVPHVLREFDRFFRGQPLQSEISEKRAATMTQEWLAKRSTKKG